MQPHVAAQSCAQGAGEALALGVVELGSGSFSRIVNACALSVVAAVLIVFIPTVGDYVTPDIIGGGKLPLIANVIQKQLLAIDNMPLGSAVAVSAMLIVGVIAAGFVLANARFLKVKK